jgi:tol-pal system protein YbgF
MIQNQMRALMLAAIGGLILLGAPAAMAQKAADLPQPALPLADPSEIINNKGIEKRLEREEKALRELRQIVLQAKAQGNPVTVKDAGPDPEVVDLQSRVDDLEQTLRKQTGQMEIMAHDSALAAKAAADAGDAAKALASRLDSVEKQLAALQPATAAGPAPQGPNGGPLPEGSLGTLPAGALSAQSSGAPSAAPADDATTYRQARETLDSGDYVGGAQALQDFVRRFPSSPRAPEANYWLGRTLALRNMHAEAAAAYARSLKGWPQTPWAGDAVVRLSASLIELKREPDACRAMGEYASHYAAKAAPALAVRAKDVRGRAGCG